MKKELTTKIYKKEFKIEENHTNINQFLKAIILEFEDEKIIVENDNYGKKRKYADFTNGKKKAGLHPMQIVFSGIEAAKITHQKYIKL